VHGDLSIYNHAYNGHATAAAKKSTTAAVRPALLAVARFGNVQRHRTRAGANKSCANPLPFIASALVDDRLRPSDVQPPEPR
jgi:hypothetical protein